MRKLPSHSALGFTLVELLVVIAIIGVLVAILLPAVQAAREAARRTQCANNLHQIALACHSYENSNRTLPVGGLVSGGRSYGHSWWVRIMPYVEQAQVFDQFDQDGSRDPVTSSTGWISENWGPGNQHNRRLLYDISFPVMYCPSSSLPKTVLNDSVHNARVMSPTYTGIAGATDHSSARDKSLLGGAAGRISWGGSLVVGRAVKISEIRDGTTNTMLIGEQSDFCRDAAGNKFDCRSDCGHGFCMGPGDDGWERHFNLTTVVHRMNEKSWNSLGVPGNCGPNRAIQSAHSGGAMVAMADGSTQFLKQTMDTQALYDLANRDDGNVTLSY